MTDPEEVSETIRRHTMAPELVELAAKQYGAEELAELTADLDVWLRERCEQDDLGPYAAYAACYMFIDRNAGDGADDEAGADQDPEREPGAGP